MKKPLLVIIFLLFFLQCRSQLFHYLGFRNGISYSSLTYGNNNGSPIQTIRGMNYLSSLSFGMANIHNSTIGLEVNYSWYSTRDFWTINPFNNYGNNYKYSIKITSRFLLPASFELRPFIGYNYYRNSSFIVGNRNFSYECGLSLLYQHKKMLYELTFGSFPEYDHLIAWKNISTIYRIKALHFPSLSLGINYILDKNEYLDYFRKKINDEKYFSKARRVRIEAGVLNFTPAVGLNYRFKSKNEMKVYYTLGVRFGHIIRGYNETMSANAYFSLGVPVISKPAKHYHLNMGAEVGGGFIGLSSKYDGSFIPFPLVQYYVENEFSHFIIKAGIGTGFYLTIGYKIF